VEFRATKQKSRLIEGVVERVLEASPLRVEPRDAQYLATSPWQILDFGAEMTAKKELIIEAFRQEHLELPDFEMVTDGSEYYYRNKMEYSLYWDKAAEKIELAFRERGSHRKVPIIQSSIERLEILVSAQEIVADLNARGEEARKYQSLMLRCNQAGEVAGGLLENGRPHPVFPSLEDEILGRKYSYSPNGFFQINLPMYELALQEIADWVEGEEVLDLYAGVGTIGLSVAGKRKLTLVELHKLAVEEMQANAKDMEAEVVLAKSEDALSHIAGKDTVIVDPPRAGLHREVVEGLLAQKTPRVIYLSCNPTTQARDVKNLVAGGYKVDFVKGFNFFPKTPHIENLIILSLKG